MKYIEALLRSVRVDFWRDDRRNTDGRPDGHGRTMAAALAGLSCERQVLPGRETAAGPVFQGICRADRALSSHLPWRRPYAIVATTVILMLWAGMVNAAATPQQRCDFARITAWRTYRGCIDGILAKHAKNPFLLEHGAHARCRYAYFRKWNRFQNNKALAGSGCVGDRFVDNGDGTVTDNLTLLVWEKKTNRDLMTNPSDPHDADNAYAWGVFGETGRVFTEFLPALNGGAGFAGSNGWRLPTLAELQTILLSFTCRGPLGQAGCSCPSNPCVEPALDPENTRPSVHWSATVSIGDPSYGWRLWFNDSFIETAQRGLGGSVRAVRGGL